MQTVDPDGLILSARILADPDVNPTPEGRRRAVSTAYYALFHLLSNACADLIVGDSPEDRASDEWAQAYRSLDHGQVWRQCRQQVVSRYHPGIRLFARTFHALQPERHEADYSARKSYDQAEANNIIDRAESAIAAFAAAPERERRRFIAYVALRQRRQG